jgi:hypothetical protein
MNGSFRIAGKLMIAVVLVVFAAFCGVGFVAAFELDSPNVFHVLYTALGMAALFGSALLTRSAAHQDRGAWAQYWRPFRLAALFSTFSVVAVATGELAWLGYLLFLCFLLPNPIRPRTAL